MGGCGTGGRWEDSKVGEKHLSWVNVERAIGRHERVFVLLVEGPDSAKRFLVCALGLPTCSVSAFAASCRTVW